MRRYKLTERAAGDIRSISDYTDEQFGPAMRVHYVGLVRQAIADPFRFGVSPCRNGDEGALAYHLRHVRQATSTHKIKTPRHLLIYRVMPNGFISILRVLHDRMDPSRHVGKNN